MKVLIYSAIRLFGDTLTACLRSEEEITAVHLENELDGLTAALEGGIIPADIALVDITCPKGVAAVEGLTRRRCGVPIIALAVPRVADDVIACADAGFVSYVPRDTQYTDLIKIASMALHGETPCDPKISRSLLEEVGRRGQRAEPEAEIHEPLTRRQSEILLHLTQGLSNKEIATELCLSVATVKNHVHLVLRKLRLKSRVEAATLANRYPSILR